MNLQNGYKVIYDKSANGEHALFASKTGVFADAEEIVRVAVGEYKLVYEKDGRCYGSKTGIPTEDDYCFAEFDKVFVADAETLENEPIAEAETPETVKEEPDAGNEEPVIEE